MQFITDRSKAVLLLWFILIVSVSNLESESTDWLISQFGFTFCFVEMILLLESNGFI